jgi:hypothetical protein
MKKLVLLLFVIFNSLILMSQSLIVTGDTALYGSSIDFQLTSHLTVKNISSDTLRIICEKNVVSQTFPGWNTFCWGGSCYGESTMISTKMDTLDAGEATTGFTGYYYPEHTSANAVIEYCFYPDTDPFDITCISVTYYATGITSINSLESSEKIGSFYPNPSSEYTNIEFNLSKPSVLQFTDVLGNIVKIVELEGSGERTIYVGDLKKGIYFGSLIDEGEIVKIKKLIINK